MAVRRLTMTAVRARSIDLHHSAGKAAFDDDCLDILSSRNLIWCESSPALVEMRYPTHEWSAHSHTLNLRVLTGRLQVFIGTYTLNLSAFSKGGRTSTPTLTKPIKRIAYSTTRLEGISGNTRLLINAI